MKKLCVVLAVTLSAALLAACGGGDSSDSTSASTGGGELSKAEWISRADEICRNYKAETRGLTAEFEALEISSKSSSADLTQAAELLRQLDAEAGKETDALRGLEPPSDAAATIDSMLSKVEATRDFGLEVADALENGEESKVQKVVGEGEKVKTEAKEMASTYGLKNCGS